MKKQTPVAAGAPFGPRAVRGAAITVSVVSHGHGLWLARLLPQLAATAQGAVAHVVVTHNIPEARLAGGPWPFALTERHNPRPLGFGANHNRAFAECATPLFAVLNPDIELTDPQVWHRLAACAQQTGVGCAYPVLRNTDGSVQDNQRAVPTPRALWRRRMQRLPDTRVDWASAAFWVVRAQAYRALGGFDERYFMYCEDTDFCLRLQSAGWALVQAPAEAVHHAQRGSHRRLRHLAWHVASLLRLWSGRPLRVFLRRCRAAPPG